jgi:hypothetical protein
MKRRWGRRYYTDHKLFEVVESDFGGGNRDSKLLPLAGETLAKENTLSGLAGLADGVFVLEGLLVNSDGTAEKAYVDVVLLPVSDTWNLPITVRKVEFRLLHMRLVADRVARASILDDYTARDDRS